MNHASAGGRLSHPGPALAALVLFSLSWAGGCASTGSGPANPDYIQAYEARRYQQAYDGAAGAAPKLKGAAREQALLVQGESAHALNRNAESKELLRPLTESNDPRIAGQSAATLGLIYQEEGNYDEGAKYLTLAAGKLDGDAAARAALYAGDCHKAAGRTSEARLMYEQAQSLVRTDNSLRGMIGDRLSGGTPAGVGKFSLQVGAFSTRQRAQAQADRLRQTASNLGLGSPTIVEIVSKGKPLYTVRVGRFATRDAALKAAKGLGVDATIKTD